MGVYKGLLIFGLLWLLLGGCSQRENPPLPAEAPSDLTTTIVSASSIRLSWQDNGLYEQAFHIERSVDGADYIPIADVAGDVEEYLDSGLSQGLYTYRVNATGKANTTPYSNESTRELWQIDACLEPPLEATETFSGYFFELPISGLSYRNRDHISYTDSSGNYHYTTSGLSEFYLGYTPIGSVTNSPYVRYVDLAEALGAEDHRDIIFNNLLRLLMTLDSDDDPLNGIHIPCELSSRPYREINFRLDEQAFATQPGMEELVGWKPMISAESARTYYYFSAARYYAGSYSMQGTLTVDNTLPVNIAFTMTLTPQGQLQMEGIEQPDIAAFNPATGDFSLYYVNIEMVIYYLVVLGNIDPNSLLYYYPYAFSMTGHISPEHQLAGDATLHSLNDNYSAAVTGGIQ